MNEKYPYIDDVHPGEPIRADWANAVRDAAMAHYPGGSFVGNSRGGYHRAPPPGDKRRRGSLLRFGILMTDLDLGGSCTIQEYTYDKLGRLCIAGGMFEGYDPLGELQGTAGITGCIFQYPNDDPKGRAEIIRVTCPFFHCILCESAET